MRQFMSHFFGRGEKGGGEPIDRFRLESVKEAKQSSGGQRSKISRFQIHFGTLHPHSKAEIDATIKVRVQRSKIKDQRPNSGDQGARAAQGGLQGDDA